MRSHLLAAATALLMLLSGCGAKQPVNAQQGIKWLNGHPVATDLGSAYPGSTADPSQARAESPKWSVDPDPEVQTPNVSEVPEASEEAETAGPPPIQSTTAAANVSSSVTITSVKTEPAPAFAHTYEGVRLPNRPGPTPLIESKPEPAAAIARTPASASPAAPPAMVPSSSPALERSYVPAFTGATAKAASAVNAAPAMPAAVPTPPVQVAAIQPPSASSTSAPSAAPEPLLSSYGAALLAAITPHQPPSEGEGELARTPDLSYELATSWSVNVTKSLHRLDVYYQGHLFRSYHAVFGRNPEPGTKRWEGDLRTPEGVYAIIDKYYSPRFHRFLLLNYPNSIDRQRYEAMRHAGIVPVQSGQRREVGGAIGIHGTDRPRFNRESVNWTTGCISVDNDAIVDLDKILPIGTVVIIRP